MPTLHFLNVGEGDCSIIEHGSGRVTVIDVSKARSEEDTTAKVLQELTRMAAKASGNHQQKEYPVNPIWYMKDRGLDSVFRFIVTHPDMDHLDGIKDFFEEFDPANLWDTDNTKTCDFSMGSPYREEDWNFYVSQRDGSSTSPKRLTLFSGSKGPLYNQDSEGASGGDCLHILAPTNKLVCDANDCDDYNDCSYVILYRAAGGRIIFGGDSHDKTWEHILATHRKDIENIDLLIAPHHGRRSGRSYDFLDVLKPKLTFFGNAPAQDLAYSAWSSRDLPHIINNQANCMVVDVGSSPMKAYVTYETFAKNKNPYSSYNSTLKAWYLQDVS